MTNQPRTAAARFLTEMALRPDLSATLSDEELRIQLDYDRLGTLQRRREALRFELESCRNLMEQVEKSLTERVATARFSLRARTGFDLAAGRAA
ncbi:MAG: hypothetical protein VX498_11285 [Myxococcota bacterium]|nr:hypothetical protein [Myxococcota bacterium]